MLPRRTFLSRTSAATAGLALGYAARAAEVAEPVRLRVAVVGLGRGLEHVRALLTLPAVEIAYLAEVDPSRLATGLRVVAEKQPQGCRGVEDFRTVLDDAHLDAVFLALPNFWHTPAALLCLRAGKHVYVEKPGSQNPKEAEMLVAAAQRSGRVVGMGNQRRTWMREGIAALHAGEIGALHYARAFYYNSRPPITSGAKPPPANLNLDLWQGPVLADRDIKPYIHYDWHWLWHWGNGELGNNGIHTLDILRWGLGVETPLRVSYLGGRYWHTDKQETPDTGTAVYDCGAVGFSWEQSSCHPRLAEKPLGECVFYGEGGAMALTRDRFTVYDRAGAVVRESKGAGLGDAAHIGNFLGAIRGTETLHSPIAEGQKSTMLCHLGNLAYRTGEMLQVEAKTGRVVGSAAAEKLWGREKYREGWMPEA